MRHRKSIFTIFILIQLITPFSAAFAQPRELVIVTSTKNAIAPIERNDLRRLFLGLKPKRAPENITPINNRSEDLMYEVFLQKIIHMSAGAYERHLLSEVFTHGTQRIKTADEFNKLLKELQYNENSISFVWAEDLKASAEIQVVQSIWKGDISQ